MRQSSPSPQWQLPVLIGALAGSLALLGVVVYLVLRSPTAAKNLDVLAGRTEPRRELPPAAPARRTARGGVVTGTEKSGPTDVIQVAGAPDLWRAYADNVAAGDAKFTGKMVEFVIHGEVFKKDEGRYYISAQGINTVFCHVLPADNAKLLLVPANSESKCFRVRGVCRGTEDARRDEYGYPVYVRDCRVIDVLTWDASAQEWRPIK